ADMIAFNLAIAGGDFDLFLGLPGAPTLGIPPAADDHTATASVGMQLTVDSPSLSSEEMDFINLLVAMADEGKVDLIVKGRVGGYPRGWYRLGDSGSKAPNTFQAD